MNYLFFKILPVLVVVVIFLALSYADDSQKTTASGVLENDSCNFWNADAGVDHFLDKKEACITCRNQIEKLNSINLKQCCACCLYDQRKESVIMKNSLENKPTCEVIHSCDESPKITMMSRNVALEGETSVGNLKNSCLSTHTLKESLDQKENGSLIECLISTNNCKDSKEIYITKSHEDSKNSGIGTGVTVGIGVGVASDILENDSCHFWIADAGVDNFLDKKEACLTCRNQIEKLNSINLKQCCACCFYDQRKESVILKNSFDNKPTCEVIHSCDESPEMTMMFGNITLDGVTSFKAVDNSCISTHMLRKPLDEKYNGTLIKCQILTENCKDSEEINVNLYSTSNGDSDNKEINVGRDSNNLKKYIGCAIGGGVLSVLIVLTIIICCCCCWKRRRTPALANGRNVDLEKNNNVIGNSDMMQELDRIGSDSRGRSIVDFVTFQYSNSASVLWE